MITQDSGYVIFNVVDEKYYCTLNKWDKQPRNDKVYHSRKMIDNVTTDLVNNKGIDRSKLLVLHATIQIN